jgi:hypothetical protein
MHDDVFRSALSAAMVALARTNTSDLSDFLKDHVQKSSMDA